MTDGLPARLSSARALAALARAVGSRDVAISLLSDALRGGVVLAEGRDTDDHLGRLRLVPLLLWQAATEQDRQQWSWSGGVFSSSNPELLSVGGRRYEDVTFDTVGVLDLCDEHGNPANIEDNASQAEKSAREGGVAPQVAGAHHSTARGGNPGKVDAWHRFWLAAMTMLDEGELEDRQRFPTQKRLMDELRSKIDDDLSEESIKPQVSKIWLRFVIRGG